MVVLSRLGRGRVGDLSRLGDIDKGECAGDEEAGEQERVRCAVDWFGRSRAWHLTKYNDDNSIFLSTRYQFDGRPRVTGVTNHAFRYWAPQGSFQY
jgi:hypothetical protein